MTPDKAVRREQSWVGTLLGYGEFLLNAAVAVALAGGGGILLATVLYDFVRRLGRGPFVANVLSLLSGLLLIFIFTELIGTVRVVIASRTVKAEPFLIVGIVAAIRRVIVLGAEAKDELGSARFRDVMTEIGLLTGGVLVLGLTVYLLRVSRSEVEDQEMEAPDAGPPP